MPGLVNRSGGQHSGGIWSRQRDDITFDQLQKFWSELPLQDRQELLRIDKQTLFERARKNLYCSRCNGLLLEGFSQIVMYRRSLQQEGGGVHHLNIIGASKTDAIDEPDDVQDPSVHPWGGLAATRDGILTLLECFKNAKSLRPLQNVFDSARAREQERELLYPDACGGGGRGWISQGMASYGRGHGTRETCALHTARLSCDTLVDFWSALSDETRFSLLRMKEEDFIERLMYRFDSKRFCRDCRKNVIREFKELKELKRMRREPRCTRWFCVADTAFQYEVSEDTVQADWHQSFTDTVGTYHHFEWAIGTGEGKSDILDFEDVGMNGEVHVDGLDLGDLSACFITLRAWKLDGRCSELSVKAHAVKGQPCVHRRLVVGDGFVTITKGESIRRFFEHAEEAEEEEDDDAMDKDGNEFDAEGSRPQKHAKSPELAREFLLDAATVIFKEQVEKAFREGTARQNAHSIFVCLALKLLEERIHVACKEIITLEKQSKLLEEEEREKLEEEERKERRRTKEREKKLRRKERIKGKEREREGKQTESKSLHFGSLMSVNDSPTSMHDESPNSLDSADSISNHGDSIMTARPQSPDNTNEQCSNGCVNTDVVSDSLQHCCYVNGELNSRDGNSSFILEQSKSARWDLRLKKNSSLEQASKWCNKHQPVISNEVNLQRDECGGQRPSRGNVVKNSARSCSLKFNERFHGSNRRIRYDFHSCGCDQHVDCRGNVNYISTIRSGRGLKAANKKESLADMSRAIYRSVNGVIPKGKLVAGTPSLHTKQVWEPMDARKKCTRSNSDIDISLRAASKLDRSNEDRIKNDEEECQQQGNLLDTAADCCSSESSKDLGKVGALGGYQIHKDQSNQMDQNRSKNSSNFGPETKSDCFSEDGTQEEVGSCPAASTFNMHNGCDLVTSSSCSDNCSSSLSEGDSSMSSSSAQNADSSSISDLEDASLQSDGRDNSTSNGSAFHRGEDDALDSKRKINEQGSFTSKMATGFSVARCVGDFFPREESIRAARTTDNGGFEFDTACRQQHLLPLHSQNMHAPIFSSPRMGYCDQSAVLWSPAPTNGFVPFPQHSHYLFPGPVGHGLAANRSSDLCTRFMPVQSPVLNVQQSSLYQSSNRVVGASTKEQTQNLEARGAQQVNGTGKPVGSVHVLERPYSSRQLSSNPSTVIQNGIVGNADRSRGDSSSFSLFHFGGPMPGAAGCNVNPVPIRDNTRGLPSASPTVQGDLACSKQELQVQEYSLFAANNGSRFSFL